MDRLKRISQLNKMRIKKLEEKVLILKDHKSLLLNKVSTQQTDLDARLNRMMSMEDKYKKLYSQYVDVHNENCRLQKYEDIVRKSVKKVYFPEKVYQKDGNLVESKVPKERTMNNLMHQMKKIIFEDKKCR